MAGAHPSNNPSEKPVEISHRCHGSEKGLGVLNNNALIALTVVVTFNSHNMYTSQY